MDAYKTTHTALKNSILISLVTVLLASQIAFCGWLKMNPPPDVDKKTHGHTGSPTCWLATAANMLAGAGYGTGSTVQARADSIYNQLVANYGTAISGWADTAISWWLQSSNNIWPNNPYVSVTVYGNKTATPWAHNLQGGFGNRSDDGPQFIANELRRCQMLGISINFGFTGGGHVFSAWGDNNSDSNALTSNPTQVIITDSDGMEYYGDTSSYTYSLGSTGWWINYNNNTFIKHILTLCPVDDPNDPNTSTSKNVSSYRVCNKLGSAANGIHHTVGANVEILSYLTTIDWQTSNLPSIYERSPRTNVCFAWDVSDNPVPVNSCVTVTDTLVLPYSSTTTINITSWNPFFYNPTPPDDPNQIHPDFVMNLLTPELPGGANLSEPDITGGYVVGAFDLYSDPAGQSVVSEHRFCMEYEYFQNPENHELSLLSLVQEPRFVGNFRFGHSYGLLEGSPLWNFAEWMAGDPRIELFEAGNAVNIPFTLPGLLAYPRGENYIPEIPQRCGDPGTEYAPQDLNKDCYVNFADFAEFAQGWLICTNPQDQSCLGY